MQLITPENHPPCVAIIDGRSHLQQAFINARDTLCVPQYIAAVIVRNKDTLRDTHARAAQLISHWGDLRDDLLMAVVQDRYGIRPAPVFKWIDVTPRNNEAEYPSDFPDVVGTDFYDLLRHSKHAMPWLKRMVLRNHDGPNGQFHLDFKDSNSCTLPGGVTTTMATTGGGTVIFTGNSDALKHDCREWVLLLPFNATADKIWQVDSGDIVLMRAMDWPKTHKPCIHKSPDRKAQGNSAERIVGVLLS